MNTPKQARKEIYNKACILTFSLFYFVKASLGRQMWRSRQAQASAR